MRIHVAILFLLGTIVASYGQTGYNLQFSIDGWRDTTVFLGNYHGESTFVKDTARVKTDGEFSFTGQVDLPQGVYFLAMGASRPTKMFGFVVGKAQSFSLSTDTSNYVAHMKVSGDPDNKLFFGDMIFNMERNREAEPFLKILRDSSMSDNKKKEAREQLQKVNEKVLSHQDDIILEYPSSVTARILKAYRPLQSPSLPKEMTAPSIQVFS